MGVCLNKKVKVDFVISIIYFVITFLSFSFLNSHVNRFIPRRFRYLLAIVFVIISIFFFILTKRKNITKKEVFFFLSNSMPYLVMIIILLIKLLFSDQLAISNAKDKFIIITYYLIPIFEMVCAVHYLKERTIDITFYAAITSYTINVLIYLAKYKIRGIINFFDYGTRVGSVLEVHVLTFCLGLFFIYYLLFENKTKKNHKKKIIVSFAYLFLGFKRIEMLAIVISILVYKIVKKTNVKRERIMFYIGIIVFIICYLYISFINKGGLDILASKYNINFMSRLEAYDYFRENYSISLFYQGKGIGYVTNELMSLGGKLYGIGDLHNDILKYYIELGAIGSALLFMNYLLFQTKRLFKRFGSQVTLVYFTLTIYTFVNLCTDNVSRYLEYILVYTMIPYVYTLTKNDKNSMGVDNEF